ncbi:MAG: FAD-binding oxidoreductase [Pseudomonadota bacterium]
MTNPIQDFAAHLTAASILFDAENVTPYASDASFLTLGKPGLIVFPINEEQVLEVVRYASEKGIALTPRAKGSSTAGASLAPEGGVIVITDRLGVVNAFGRRLGLPPLAFYTAAGAEVARDALDAHRDEEVYARVGAGLSTEELDRMLQPLGWQSAVVPSSGWSTIAGNFATNAGGNGTPKYGTFQHVVNRLRVVASRPGGAEVVTVTDRDILRGMGGGQGLYGIITELDTRVVPRLSKEELHSSVCACVIDDVEALGEVVGAFMVAMEEVTKPIIAEFMMADKGLFKAGDKLLDHPEIGPLFDYPTGSYKFIMMYQGRRDEMSQLAAVAEGFPKVTYQETTPETFKILLDLRKAATGKSPGRVAIPGFEDIYVEDPRDLGRVLKAIYAITEGSLPGRPIGHQYTGGLVIHYRPLAALTRAEYQEAWELTQRLCAEVCTERYHTVKRREHGLGLELFALSSPEERARMKALKASFDPVGIFQPHLMTESPDIRFVGDRFRAYSEGTPPLP